MYIKKNKHFTQQLLQQQSSPKKVKYLQKKKRKYKTI